MERFCNDIRQAVRQKDYAAVLELWEKAKTLPGWETMRNILETEGIGDEIKRHTVRESFDSALCTHTLSGHSEPVTGIAVSLDANLIASAGQDTTIRIWNIAEQRREADLTGHRDWVRSIALTTDARFLVSGSWDGSVHIWNIAEKKTIRSFGERIKLLTKIALSPQGNIVAVANAAGSVLLWDVLSNTVLNRYTNRSSVNAVRFSRCGRYLVSGSDDGSVTIYPLPRKADGTRSPLNDRTFHDHQYPITAVAISTDRRTLFSADANGHIIVRKLQNNSAQEQGTFTAPSQTHGIQAHG
jgi:WD40 repeat protein